MALQKIRQHSNDRCMYRLSSLFFCICMCVPSLTVIPVGAAGNEFKKCSCPVCITDWHIVSAMDSLKPGNARYLDFKICSAGCFCCEHVDKRAYLVLRVGFPDQALYLSMVV